MFGDETMDTTQIKEGYNRSSVKHVLVFAQQVFGDITWLKEWYNHSPMKSEACPGSPSIVIENYGWEIPLHPSLQSERPSDSDLLPKLKKPLQGDFYIVTRVINKDVLTGIQDTGTINVLRKEIILETCKVVL